MVLPVPNKLHYPPEFQDKSRLVYYSSLFNSIEVNSSFYKLPQSSTIKKWAESVPENFRFTFKLWREITHNKALDFRPEDVQLFMERIAPASNRKGCLLGQFPPSLSVESAHRLEYLLSVINEVNAEYHWNVALEFRNRSWYTQDIYDLVQESGATIVLQDLPASATPMPEKISRFIYLRFHGPSGGYRGSYADDYLYEYAQYVSEWAAESAEVFVYFNNTMGNAVHNLVTLNKFLSENMH